MPNYIEAVQRTAKNFGALRPSEADIRAGCQRLWPGGGYPPKAIAADVAALHGQARAAGIEPNLSAGVPMEWWIAHLQSQV